VSGDPRFHAILEEVREIHDRKQADYGRPADPFANVRASQEWGIEPWVGAMVRATDKVRRLQTAATGSTLQNEGIEDSLLDLATYALIALVLFREEEDLPSKLANAAELHARIARLEGLA
jgi:hypothetical protein